MKVAVIISALNEQKTIQSVIKEVPRKIGNHQVIVIVVDDGSTDSTAELARQSGADIVHSHPQNLGIGPGFDTGLRLAQNQKADIICTLDADGQFDASQLPDIVKPILEGRSDAVVGTRFNAEYANTTVPLSNRLTNKIMALILSILLVQRFRDVTSGYRAFHSRTVPFFQINQRWNTHSFLFDLRTAGFNIIEVPVSVKYFAERKSKAFKSFASYAKAVVIDIAIRVLPLLNRNYQE